MDGPVTDSTANLLESAILKYITRAFDEADWIDLGIETGTLDLIQNHERLLRSLSFGDVDYSQHAVSVGKRILKTMSGGRGPGRPLKLEDVTPAFPGLKNWLKDNDFQKYEKLFSVPARKAVTNTATEKEAAKNPVANKPALRLAPDTDKTLRVPQVDQAAPGKGKAADAEGEIFIVHGHDHGLRNELYIFLQEVTGKKPVILDFQASGGKTLIEKFESKALKASVAVVLLTPDDVGAAKGSSDLQPRARQNVVFEMGYFVGSLDRSRVITINDGVEAPSDIAGLVYIPKSGNWYEKLRRELIEAGVRLVA